jgi:hypothetical protein
VSKKPAAERLFSLIPKFRIFGGKELLIFGIAIFNGEFGKAVLKTRPGDGS